MRIALIAIAVILALGLLGLVTSRGYHCKTMTVGNSQVCA